MKFISYYTSGAYKKVMDENLLPTLQEFKLPYYIEEVPDLGSWKKNTDFKPTFILQCLEKYKEDIVFIDADAQIVDLPSLFYEIPKEYDMAVHYLDWCYSSNTEIYTNKGWKFLSDISKNDKVYTLNLKKNTMELEKPLEIISKNYKGDMYSFKNNKIDLLVTPNHRMLYKTDQGQLNQKEHLKILPAKDLYNIQRFKFITGGQWGNKDVEYFILPKYKNFYGNKGNIIYKRNPIKIPMILWCKFLGWYLSEGCCSTGMASISQSKNSQYIKELDDIFKSMTKVLGCNYSVYDCENNILRFNIFSTQLEKYLKRFGKAKEKYIPEQIKNLSSNQIEHFIHAYVKGDGSFSNRNFVIFTGSDRMKDDLEECLFKIGKSVKITKKISGFGKEIYVISARKGYTSIRRNYKNKEQYNGNVHCISTKNGLIYIRKNGSGGVWSGNCKFWRNQKDSDNFELCSGTMMFRYNKRVISLCEEYIKQCEKERSKIEQKVLQDILEDNKNIKIYQLPIEYCAIQKHNGKIPSYIKNPKIIHTQASRENR